MKNWIEEINRRKYFKDVKSVGVQQLNSESEGPEADDEKPRCGGVQATEHMLRWPVSGERTNLPLLVLSIYLMGWSNSFTLCLSVCLSLSLCCIVIFYNYTHIHAEYILPQRIKTSEDFLKKKIPLTLFERLCVRGSWRLIKDCSIVTSPAPLDVAMCRSRSPGLLNRGPGVQPLWDMFSFRCLLTNWSPNSQLGVPRAPSAGWWLSLPHLVSNSSDLKLTDFLSSPSYIIVQSPTQSLEWHVWSSSSGNNCHAVQRSLSSGASVDECTMGFYLAPYCPPSPPTRFLFITAIGMCHFLPVHHFGMACLAGSKVNIQHLSLSLFGDYYEKISSNKLSSLETNWIVFV